MADEPISSEPMAAQPFPNQHPNKAFYQAQDQAANQQTAHDIASVSEHSEEPEQSALVPLDADEAQSEERREAEDPYEGAVPPGYDWPTHGGYLGCLLSLMASCLIGGFLGTTIFAALSYHGLVPRFVAILLTVVVYAAVIVGLGRLGWVLGKRFYREYPQNRYPVWGEDDEEKELPQTIITLAEGQPEAESTDEKRESGSTPTSANAPEATEAPETIEADKADISN